MMSLKLSSRAASAVLVAGILAATLTGNAGSAQSASQSGTNPGHSPAKRVTLEGVGNFAEVTPMLYRGGQPKPLGFEGLAKLGINIVVDVRLSGKDKERKEVEKAGMQYVAIPWHCL